MAGFAYAGYGAIAYALSLATLLYTIGFVGNLPLPKSIDSGGYGPIRTAILVDLALLSIFAVQHSVMARPAFKRWWTRLVPPPVERATYVLFASLALDLLFWQWRPIAGSVWRVTHPAGIFALWSIGSLGWGLVVLSTFLINHFELFGLRQVYDALRRFAPPLAAFRNALALQVRACRQLSQMTAAARWIAPRKFRAVLS